MSPFQRAVLGGYEQDRELAAKHASTHSYAMFEELSFVRREAQADADEAYEDWRMQLSGDGYAVYRAAQDRADAAQDDLASWVRRIDLGR
jgi:hypothetical protein